jgi:hypothetical protein
MVTAEVLADDQEYNDVSGVGLSCLLCCACCAVPAVPPLLRAVQACLLCAACVRLGCNARRQCLSMLS